MPEEQPPLRVVRTGSADEDARDKRLVRGVIAGDADRLRELISLYDRLVRYTIYRTAGGACRRDPSFLDGCASEVWSGFVESVRRAGSGPNGSLGPYLTGIARNKSLDHLRRQAAEETGEDAAERSVDTYEYPSPLDIIVDAERTEVLRSCIATLSNDDRNLFSEIELITNRRWREAAEKLGIPESTLRSRWARLLDDLRRRVEEKS